jgi:hypothetical protein
MSRARRPLLLLCVALCASCFCARVSAYPGPRRAAGSLQAAEAAAADEAAMRTAGSGAAALFNVLLRAAGVPGGVANALVFDKLQSAYLTTARGGSTRVAPASRDAPKLAFLTHRSSLLSPTAWCRSLNRCLRTRAS